MNYVLDNKIERESNLTRKQSVTVHAEKVFTSAFNYNTVQGEIPTDAAFLTLPGQEPSETPTSTHTLHSKFTSEVKKDVKAKVF